jgi:hypothetical protein
MQYIPFMTQQTNYKKEILAKFIIHIKRLSSPKHWRDAVQNRFFIIYFEQYQLFLFEFLF